MSCHVLSCHVIAVQCCAVLYLICVVESEATPATILHCTALPLTRIRRVRGLLCCVVLCCVVLCCVAFSPHNQNGVAAAVEVVG